MPRWPLLFSAITVTIELAPLPCTVLMIDTFAWGRLFRPDEVGEFLLRCVDGVGSFVPVEHVCFCRQPIKIVAEQLARRIVQLELQK